LTADTIRYYEREGLLPPPDRTASGYRAYDEDAVERLRFIKGAQRIGLRLQEIKELLDIRDRGLCPCGHIEDLLSRRVSEVDAEITRLQETRTDLMDPRRAHSPAEETQREGARGHQLARRRERAAPRGAGPVNDDHMGRIRDSR
jgi:DNA-binding transcriptional MerR regulator